MPDRWTLTLNDRAGLLDPLKAADLDWWLPTLGPTATLLLPRLIRCAQQPVHVPDDPAGIVLQGAQVDPEGLAYQCGVPVHVIAKTVRRLERFRMLTITPQWEIDVRRWLTAVPPYNVLTAPSWWQAAYVQATGLSVAALTP